jgi:hypothetical protein
MVWGSVFLLVQNFQNPKNRTKKGIYCHNISFREKKHRQFSKQKKWKKIIIKSGL